MNDFKLIRGIGPAVEERLQNAGILTYSQLASMSPNQLADLFTGLIGFTSERIIEQDWIGQAGKLAARIEQAEAEPATYSSNSRQHYAVFTLELLLDDENQVRRTRLMHVQSQGEDTWPGWDESRLVSFLIDRANLHVPVPDMEVKETGIETGLKAVAPLPSTREHAARPLTDMVTGQLHLLDLETQTAGAVTSRQSIPKDQPFNMRIKLDLSEISAPLNAPLNYSVTIYSRRLGSGIRQVVGNSQGTFMPANNVIIDVGGRPLSQGTYRLDTVMVLASHDQEPKPGSGPMAMAEGNLFQVY